MYSINTTTKKMPSTFILSDPWLENNTLHIEQQENDSHCAVAFAKYDFVNPREHLAQYLPQDLRTSSKCIEHSSSKLFRPSL